MFLLDVCLFYVVNNRLQQFVLLLGGTIQFTDGMNHKFGMNFRDTPG